MWGERMCGKLLARRGDLGETREQGSHGVDGGGPRAGETQER